MEHAHRHRMQARLHGGRKLGGRGGPQAAAAVSGRREGPQAVPLTLSMMQSTLQRTLSDDEIFVNFVLSYECVQTPVMWADLHGGQRHSNGGRADCPQEGTSAGEMTTADMFGRPPLQRGAHDVLKGHRPIRQGETSANVHTMMSPGGAMRGQRRVWAPRAVRERAA